MLWATQEVRVFTAVAEGLSPIVEGNASLRGLVLRSLPLGKDVEQPRFTLNHNVTYISSRTGNQTDPASRVLLAADHVPDTLSTNACLTEPTASHPQCTCEPITLFKR